MRRVWHRHWNVTLYMSDDDAGSKMRPTIRRRWQRYRQRHEPWLWWSVMGKKWFDTHSLALRSSWKIGNYDQ